MSDVDKRIVRIGNIYELVAMIVPTIDHRDTRTLSNRLRCCDISVQLLPGGCHDPGGERCSTADAPQQLDEPH